jgi:hypothetical protein
MERIELHGSAGALGEGEGAGEAAAMAAARPILWSTTLANMALLLYGRAQGVVSRHTDDPFGYVLSDGPIGGYRRAEASGMLEHVAIEVGVILLTIAGFAALQLYVMGCERV